MKFTLTFLAAVGAVLAQDQPVPSLTDLLGGNQNLSSLVALLGENQDILDALGDASNITIFAPNNDAIANFTEANAAAIEADPDLVGATLRYHVLDQLVYSSDITGDAPLFPQTLLEDDDFEQVDDGQYLKVQVVGGDPFIYSGLENRAGIVEADLNFTAGVVHIIDSVLVLPVNVSETAIAAGLSSLAGALNATDLLETVDSLDNVTIFAPNNAAFRAISSVLTAAIEADDTETLQDVLRYHVIEGSVTFSSQLEAGANITTLGGGSVTISQEGENYFVNGARIGTPNILVSGGVVHVIDQVLNPENATTPAEGATAGVVQFANSTSSEEDPLTSGVPTATTTLPEQPTATDATGPTESAEATGAAGKVAVPVMGAVAGIAAFLL